MTKEQLKKDHPELYAEIRKSGLKSLATLGKDMRSWQKRFFQTKSHEALKHSKRLEEQLDRTIDMILQ